MSDDDEPTACSLVAHALKMSEADIEAIYEQHAPYVNYLIESDPEFAAKIKRVKEELMKSPIWQEMEAEAARLGLKRRDAS